MKAEEDKNGRETATMTSRNIYWFSIGCLQSDLAYFLITWLVTASQRHAWEPIVELKKAFEEGPGWLLKRKRSVFCPDIPCILVFEAHLWTDFKNFFFLNECGAFLGAKFLSSYRIVRAETITCSFVVTYPLGSATVTCKCFRSMKKNEAPHSLEVSIGLADKTLSGKCSCVAGISRYCHHVIR